MHNNVLYKHCNWVAKTRKLKITFLVKRRKNIIEISPRACHGEFFGGTFFVLRRKIIQKFTLLPKIS